MCSGELYFCCNCSGDPFLERRSPGREEMASSCGDEKCWQCRERASEGCLDRGAGDRSPQQRARRSSAPDSSFGSLHRHFSAWTVGRSTNKRLSFKVELEPPVLWRVHEEGPEADLLQDEAEMAAEVSPLAMARESHAGGGSHEFSSRTWSGLQWGQEHAPPEGMTLDFNWDQTAHESSTGGWVVYRSEHGSGEMDLALADPLQQQSPVHFGSSALRMQAHAAAAEPHAALGGKRPRAADSRDPEATPPPPHSPFMWSEGGGGSAYSPSPVPARLFFSSGCDESMPDWGDADCNSAAGKRHAAGDGSSPHWNPVPWPHACDVV